MTNYRRGGTYEYIAKKQLEEQGYVVIRSAGSHGPADLVATNDWEIKFIQIKFQKDKKINLNKYSEDIEALRKIPISLHNDVRRELWIRIKGNTEWKKYLILNMSEVLLN